MTLEQLASAIQNDLWGGNLVPLSNRALLSVEQLEDEIIAERSSIVHEWYLKGVLNKHDLAYAINCVNVDCKDPNRCPCKGIPGDKIQHFEIPQLMDGMGNDAILFLGSTDRSVSYRVYYNLQSVNYQKYRRYGADKPYVYIEKTPNEHGMYDGWVFNAPFVKHIAIIGVFKDPRQIEGFNCCDSQEYLDMGTLSSELLRRILAKKAQLYRAGSIPAAQTTS